MSIMRFALVFVSGFGASAAAAELPIEPVPEVATDACADQCAKECAAGLNEVACTQECAEACGSPRVATEPNLNVPSSGSASSSGNASSNGNASSSGDVPSTGTSSSTGSASSSDNASSTDNDASAVGAMEASPEQEQKIRADERSRVSALYAADALAADRARKESGEDREIIRSALLTPVGIYGFVGGGATNFTQPTAVGATNMGGYWDARVGIGTRSILGAEVGYVGSARNIEALGLSSDAFLLGNGVEGVARLNVPITAESFLIEPYTFGGVGWQRYNLMTSAANTSSLQDQDDVMTVPLGLGLAFGFSGVTLDARATYRQAFGSDMFGTHTSSFANTSMNSWGAGAALGFEL